MRGNMITKRQETVGGPANSSIYWLDTPKGYILKGIIVIALIILLFVWVFVGYWHAKKRMERGLPLLWYHKLLVPPATQQNNPRIYRNERDYRMPDYPEPPPVYNNADMPPTYQPPGGNKVAEQQQQGNGTSSRETSEV